MKDGHYTKSDIKHFSVFPPSRKDITKTATCLLNDGCTMWSNGLDIQIHCELNSVGGRLDYDDIRKVPEKYKVVAEFIRQKASKHGGRRFGAGRPETDKPKKLPHTFRLTAYEYMKVKEYIEELRKE